MILTTSHLISSLLYSVTTTLSFCSWLRGGGLLPMKSSETVHNTSFVFNKAFYILSMTIIVTLHYIQWINDTMSNKKFPLSKTVWPIRIGFFVSNCLTVLLFLVSNGSGSSCRSIGKMASVAIATFHNFQREEDESVNARMIKFLCSKEHFSIFFVQYLGVTAGIEPAT